MTSQNEELIERCTKMALLLGIVRGSLGGMVECSSVSIESKKTIASLLDFLNSRIDELFYNLEPEKEKKICPNCNEVHVDTLNCKRRFTIADDGLKSTAFIADPRVSVEARAQPYTKEWQNRCAICNGYHDGLGQAPCKPPNCS